MLGIMPQNTEAHTAADWDRQFGRELEGIRHILEGMARKSGLGREDAEDAVQTVMARIYEKRHQYNGSTKLSSWGGAVMKNHLVDVGRNTAYHRKHLSAFQLDDVWEYHCPCYDGDNRAVNLIDMIRSPANVEQDACTEAMTGWLVRQVDNLHPRYVPVVRCVDVEGKSYLETAEELDCPLSRMKSLLHRGRKELRRNVLGNAPADILEALQ